MSMPGNAETLERLIIEIVGDDTKLKAALDATIKAAQDAATKMRDALNVDFAPAAQAAQQATNVASDVSSAWSKVAAAGAATAKNFDEQGVAAAAAEQRVQALAMQMKAIEDEFRAAAAAGDKTEEEFENIRRAALGVVDTMTKALKANGDNTESIERLRQVITTLPAVYKQVGKETEGTGKATEDLEERFKRLANEVRGSRNLWAGMVIQDREFKDSTRAARDELVKMLDEVKRGSGDWRKITQEIAYAQRGLDSAAGVASRGGLAWTVQIALTNQFGQALRNLGPAGAASAQAMGLVGGAVKSLFQPVTMADVSFEKLARTALRFTTVLGPMAAFVGGIAAATGLSKIALDAAKFATELTTATAKVGTSVEALQELQHAATITGVPLTALESGLVKLQQNAAEAASGNKALAASFKAVGIPVRDANGNLRSTEDLLGDVAEAMSRVEGNTAKVQVAYRLFGREGTKLLPMLQEGREGIGALRKEARELGLVISGDTVMSLTRFQAEVDTLKKQFQVAKVEIGAAFLPILRDVLLPLLQDHIIPIIQRVAGEVTAFSGTLFSASEQGDQLRGRIVAVLTPVARLATGALAFGRAVFLGIQVISASIQLLIDNTIIAWEEFKQSFGNMKLPESWHEFVTGIPDPNDSGGRGTRLDDLRAQRDARLLALLENVDAAAEPLKDAILRIFNDEIPNEILAGLESLIRPGETLGNRVGQAIGDGIGTGITNGTRTALEGSLKFAQEALAKAQEDLAYAVGESAQDAANAIVAARQADVDAILERLKEVDPARDARIWTDRLKAEISTGVKSTFEGYNLVQPVIDNLKALAAEQLQTLGYTDKNTQATLSQIGVLEAFINSLKKSSLAVGDLKAAVTAPVKVVTPETVATLNEAVVAAAAYVQGLQKEREAALLLGAAFAHLGEQGATLEQQMAFLKDSAFATALMGGPGGPQPIKLPLSGASATVVTDEISKLKAAIQDLAATDQSTERDSNLLGLINSLTKLAPQSVLELNRLTGGWYSAGEQAKEFRRTLAEAFEDSPGTFQGIVATLEARVAPALQAARERAKLLGEQFDDLAARRKIYQAIFDELSAKPFLTPGELAVMQQAGGLIEDVAHRIATIDFAKQFDAWAKSVRAVGVDLDPVAQKQAELNTLVGDGALTTEQARIATDELAAARKRLADADAAVAGEKAYRAALAASDAYYKRIRDFARVPQADFDDLRDAVREAFNAGIVKDFDAAMRGIDFLELHENLGILSQQLNEVQAIVPNLARDLMQAGAMWVAGNKTDAIATGFQAATKAVEGLKAAFADASQVGEAALDLLIGGASTLATVFGSAALGQAVGAIGGFLKSVLGDFGNGLIEIRRTIDETVASSRYLGEDLVESIANSATERVSRGGLLGLLGFTKQQLDQDAFKAGIAIAENLANGLVNTLRSSNFEAAWKQMTDDLLINGMIERFMASAAVQAALQQAMNSIDYYGDSSHAGAALDQLRDQFRAVWDQIQAIVGSEPLDFTGDLSNAISTAIRSPTVDEAWVSMTMSFKDLMRNAIVNAFLESEAVKALFKNFSAELQTALADGVISEEEYRRLEAAFGETEGPLRDLWDALEHLGLGFEDLTNVVNDATASLSNVPQVFKITQATMDAIYAGTAGNRNYYGVPITIPRDPDDQRVVVNFNAPVYGMQDFEDQVRQAVAAGDRRASLSSFGLTARSG